MHRHFLSKALSYVWLKKVTGKEHVADLNQGELHKAIQDIPKTSAVRDATWEQIK
jgi:hypothetical protein